MHLELPIVSFISAALSLAPLPWHWRAGTIPTISIALWLFVSNIINGINTIIWAGNVNIVGLVWCDISSKIIIGANVALPASVFCLCIHLERVSSVRNVSSSHALKRRRRYIDAFLCFGVPLIYMALHYIIQGHRFDIVEDFGCRANTYVSIPSIFLLWIPPLFFSLGSFVLSALAFRNFWIRRITFARHLQSNSALTPSRYFRLMAMSLVQMFWGIAITAFNMWFTMRDGLRPWISFSDVHFNFSRVAVFPTIFIPQQDLLFTFLLWWAVPVSTFLFFVFFAFGRDAMNEYSACYKWIKRVIFRVSEPSIKSKIGSLPSYVQQDDHISLSFIGKPQLIISPTKSEATLATPTSSTPKAYQWSSPPSPTATSPTCYTPSTPEGFHTYLKSHDAESIKETKSISSYCSTSHH